MLSRHFIPQWLNMCKRLREIMAGNKDFPPCRDFGAFLSRNKLAPNPGGDIAGNTRAVGYLGHVLSSAPNRHGLAMTLRESRYRTFPFSWAFCPDKGSSKSDMVAPFIRTPSSRHSVMQTAMSSLRAVISPPSR